MEIMWIQYRKADNHKAWRLVVINDRGENIQTLAQLDRHQSKWIWITEPPKIFRGSALNFDQARAAAENYLREHHPMFAPPG